MHMRYSRLVIGKEVFHMSEQVIKDYYGKIIARIVTESNGNRVLKDYYGKILGRYDVNRDVTTDYYGKIVAHGDALTMLIEK